MAKDYYLVTIIGFSVGWLILVPLVNNNLLEVTLGISWVSAVIFAVIAPVAFAVAGWLGRFWKIILQFRKFAAVGTLNTLLNIGVINFLIFLTDITSGVYYSLFVALGFMVAVINSYFWNKFWTFESRMPVNAAEYMRFLFFTLVGALLNVGAASLVVNVIGAPENFNPKLWANIGAFCGVLVSFLWNFLSYKRIVFKS